MDLNAFDERVIDNSQLIMIDTSYNPCSDRNGTFFDRTGSKGEIRAALQRCFDNYNEREDETKTENPCQWVCLLQDENKKMRLTSQNQKFEEKIKSLEHQIQLLTKLIHNMIN